MVAGYSWPPKDERRSKMRIALATLGAVTIAAGVSIGADKVALVEEEVVMEIQPLTAKQLFRQAGPDKEETFAAVRMEVDCVDS